MQQRTKNRICLLSAAVLLAGSLAAGTGRAFARPAVAGTTTILVKPDTGQSAQTLYLPDWVLPAQTAEQTEPTDQTGETVEDIDSSAETPLPSRTVKITLPEGKIQTDAYLTATAGDGTLTLTLTEAALALTEPTEAKVQVGNLTILVPLLLTERTDPGERQTLDAGTGQWLLMTGGAERIYFEDSVEIRYSTDLGATWMTLSGRTDGPTNGAALLLLDVTTSGKIALSGATGTPSLQEAPNWTPFLLESVEKEAELPLPDLGVEPTVTLQRLTAEGWANEKTPPEVKVEGQKLTVRMPEDQPPTAGTYRLTVEWTLDKNVYKRSVDFFVSYAAGI